MRLAVVLVHYHAGDLTRRALQHVALDADRCGIEFESVVIDHGGSAEDRMALAGLDRARLVVVGENRGYSGGVNRGIDETTADSILFLNPDVRLRSGALSALLGALYRGYEVVGPRLHWDDSGRFLLPPAEERGRWPALLEALAAGSETWAAIARRRWRRQARRHWVAKEPLASHDLSGGCLLVSRSAWQRVGRFDEAYRLYFEETDWLLRARRLGILAAHVPAALAVHDVGRSAARETRSQEWFEESAARFRRRTYGERFARLLERVAGRAERGAFDVRFEPPAFSLHHQPLPSLPLWVEVSPNRSGYPAAAERLTVLPNQGWRLPDTVREGMGEGRWSLRRVSERGREEAARSPAD